MIACQRLGQRDDARAHIIAFDYGGFTVVDLDIGGWKTELVILPVHEPGVLVHLDHGIAWLCGLYQASKSRSLFSKHVEHASHNEVLVRDVNVLGEHEFAWRLMVAVEAELDRVFERLSLCTDAHFTSSNPDGV